MTECHWGYQVLAYLVVPALIAIIVGLIGARNAAE